MRKIYCDKCGCGTQDYLQNTFFNVRIEIKNDIYRYTLTGCITEHIERRVCDPIFVDLCPNCFDKMKNNWKDKIKSIIKEKKS